MSKINKKDQQQNHTEKGTYNRKCFIIMPISDHKDYPVGHFLRVYEHIIKPACELSGFEPIRADDVKSTNLIALDIVKQIIECDMAICDLSSRNPNVLYEVGIRQAFNLPVTFIKDYRTERIFDIQGFRDVAYDETLRIDTVEQEIIELSETMQNTFQNKHEINSLIGLLGIEPAKISTTKITYETELILSTLQLIDSRIAKLELTKTSLNDTREKTRRSHFEPVNLDGLKIIALDELNKLKIGDVVIHKIFGEGVIVNTEYANTDKLQLFINFSNYGQKHLLAKFAPLYK
ncbi:MAG: hypothetical protein ABIN91_01930 [Mucilaginibacter sp.]|uniref:hypothetical protein n=1 Tax=Mucilaginibacter sp. TaxID=1882438 RepID=UPI003263E167